MYREEIERYIDSHIQEMAEDVCALCRINSERGPALPGMPYGEGPAKALEKALEMARGYGFSVRNYDNYVGAADFNDKEKQLDILAHLDVVPAGDGWQVTAPFEPVQKDGRIYGRGTADDKGPAVAALYAMRAVKDLGIPLTKNVRLLVGTDEECGSSDLEHYYQREEEAPMTFSPDAQFPVTNVEKGRLEGHFTGSFEKSGAGRRLVSLEAGIKANVIPAKASAVVRGLALEEVERAAAQTEQETGIRFSFDRQGEDIRIAAEGTNGHAAHPDNGNNALTGLLSLVARLDLADCGQISCLRTLSRLIPHGDLHGTALGVDREDEVSGRLTLAFSMLKVTEEGLEGCFDSRCPICSTEDNTLRVIKEKMEEAGLTLLNDSMRPPHHVAGDSLFVRTLLKAYEDYTGNKGECQYMGGGTYVHDLKNGVAFGAAMPGTDNHMHGPDEFAVLEELAVSAKIFAQVIVDLCM